MEKQHRIYSMTFASVYPLYIAKVERKGRTKVEVDKVIAWMTGYDTKGLQSAIDHQLTFKKFFKDAPDLNPARLSVTGIICGVRVEEIHEPLMREIRILDKLIDALAKGRALSKILKY